MDPPGGEPTNAIVTLDDRQGAGLAEYRGTALTAPVHPVQHQTQEQAAMGGIAGADRVHHPDAAGHPDVRPALP